ncbi:hypothetical protein V6N13_044610 [Hibiscus sabdariffa]
MGTQRRRKLIALNNNSPPKQSKPNPSNHKSEPKQLKGAHPRSDRKENGENGGAKENERFSMMELSNDDRKSKDDDGRDGGTAKSNQEPRG